MSESTRPDDRTVHLTRAGAVATIRLDRPTAMNALDDATKVALLTALTEVAGDPAVRAVVLTGTGRGFCVGQDLREHVEGLHRATADPDGDFELADTVRDHYNPIVTLLATMPKPVVAAVNGVAAGAGASFAFACDLRLVAESGGFSTAFVGIGLSCDSGASWTLPRLVGLGRATELLLLPRVVPAAEALAMGLASQVVPDAELADAAAALAQRLAAGPTVAYASVKSALAHSQTHGLTESLEHEGELMGLTGRTADHLAAVEAFMAKQKPRFEGR
ncbi:MAG TPA: enoyl-CoA hydratase-related protein [Actinomycetales bacterium]|jgi:2-(1,2-epoxy-1,2-dihydrophenyl)acetyl-CoA isomerase